MELTINTKTHNHLLSRHEWHGIVTFTGKTPSNADVQKAIAEKAGVAEDVIVVKTIATHNGKSVASLRAYVYNTADAKARVEPKIKPKADKAAAKAT